MKVLVSLLVVAAVHPAFAGIFMEKGMYVISDMTVGYGATLDEARKDANSAIPVGYKVAREINSPAVDCTGNEIWNADNHCSTEKVRYVLPLKKARR